MSDSDLLNATRIWVQASAIEVPDQVDFEPISGWTTALWVLLVDSGLRVDVGECPACRARSETRGKLARWEWCYRFTSHTAAWESRPGLGGTSNVYQDPRTMFERAAETREYLLRDGWTSLESPRASGILARAVRPCPACTVDGKPTGRDMRDAAQLLLDAAPKPWRGVLATLDDSEIQQLAHRMACEALAAEARAQLAVLADDLQTRGDELGELLAVWLAPLETDARDKYSERLLSLVLAPILRTAENGKLDSIAFLASASRLRDEPDAELRERALTILGFGK